MKNKKRKRSKVSQVPQSVSIRPLSETDRESMREEMKRDLLEYQGGGDKNTIFIDSGKEKMSEILIEFARPFFDEYGDDTQLVAEKIIAFSVTSWNMAIVSPSKRLALINSVLRTVPVSERRTAESLLLLMEERKRKHFNDINRFIINYRIKETTDSFNVFVASTPSEDQIAEIVKNREKLIL